MTAIFSDPRLQLLSLKLELEAQTSIVWGSFPGSVLHGVLGFTIRRFSCATRRERCEGCFLQPYCSYALLFEVRTPETAARMRKYPTIPPGLQLTVTPWNLQELELGKCCSVGITLFGRASDTAALLLLALEDALSAGIGKKAANSERGIAKIISLKAGEAESGSDLREEAVQPNIWRMTTWAELTAAPPQSFTIHLLTPMRIVSGGKVTAAPSFRDLFATALRRVTNLAYFYSDCEIAVDFKALVQKAEAVPYRSEFRRVELSRYSARQYQRIQQNGLIGKMFVENCSPELGVWLLLASKMGLGKNTSMGMGEYRVEGF